MINYKVVSIFVISFICLSFIFMIYNFNNKQEVKMEEEKIYQGPVRPTDDLEHFRKTGETKPLEIKE